MPHLSKSPTPSDLTKPSDGKSLNKRIRGLSTLFTFQALLASICGTLLANMSFIGKTGIWFFHNQLMILRVWWKGALILFAIQVILILLLLLLRHWTIALLFLLFGIYASYLSYIDFTTTTSRYLKFDFHLGGYLFWAGWAITCLYFIFLKRFFVK